VFTTTKQRFTFAYTTYEVEQSTNRLEQESGKYESNEDESITDNQVDIDHTITDRGISDDTVEDI